MNFIKPVFSKKPSEKPVAASEVRLHLLGCVGEGKTVTCCSLIEHLFGLMRKNAAASNCVLEDASRAVEDQYEALKQAAWPYKTAPGQDGPPEEALRFRYQGRGLLAYSYAGEDLYPDGQVRYEALERFVADPRRDIGVVVVNPFRYSAALAARSLPGLTATLQAKTGCNLPTALETAAESLFGLLPETLRKYRADWRVITRLSDARIQWQPPSAGEASAFRVEGPHVATPDAQAILEAVENIARRAVGRDLHVQNLRQLVQRHSQDCIVVLTRVDLIPFIAGMTREDLTEVFEDFFGAAPHNAQQRVLARNCILEIDPAATPLIQPSNVDPRGGAELWRAISLLLEQKQFRPTRRWVSRGRLSAAGLVAGLGLLLCGVWLAPRGWSGWLAAAASVALAGAWLLKEWSSARGGAPHWKAAPPKRAAASGAISAAIPVTERPSAAATTPDKPPQSATNGALAPKKPPSERTAAPR